MYFNAPQPPRKQSQQFSRPSHAPSERRRSSTSYSQYPAPHPSNESHNESPSQPPSRYRPSPPAYVDMYQAPLPQQQLITQPLTAYLRDRNTGVPR
jgi:hypothetical protein